jgi:hypothetical protein
MLMQTVHVNNGLQTGFDDLVQSVSRLNTTELTTFFEKLNHTLSGQKSLSSFGDEAVLLKQIQAIFPASVLRRFKELQTKKYAQSITQKEQEEMVAITDFIEEKSAERVVLLGELAKIRQISLSDLAKQLQLKNYHA